MLTIKCIPAFNDNYIWLIVDDNQQCCVVDPGDAKPVLNYLDQHQLSLAAIWVTHHHADHCGGVEALKQRFPQAVAYGPQKESIAHIDVALSQGDQVLFANQQFEVLELPGHTLGHIGYHNAEVLFCGDVLFSGGCGRVFEGTYQQMLDSLNTLKALPAATKVYAAHEYTQSNIDFALAAEPGNAQLVEYAQRVSHLRANNQATLPTTIGVESQINPFFRSEIINTSDWETDTQLTQPIEVFTHLRDWKNRF